MVQRNGVALKVHYQLTSSTLLMLVILAAALLLVACGGGSEPTTPGDVSQSVAVASPPTNDGGIEAFEFDADEASSEALSQPRSSQSDRATDNSNPLGSMDAPVAEPAGAGDNVMMPTVADDSPPSPSPLPERFSDDLPVQVDLHELFVMSAAGGDPVLVQKAVWFPELLWAPDGRTLAFRTSDEVWLSDSDGAARRLFSIGTQGFRIDWLDWSPDSTRLAVGVDIRRGTTVPDGPPFSSRILIADVASGQVDEVATTGLERIEPLGWLPDSEHYLMALPDGVVVVSATNGEVVGLVPPEGGWISTGRSERSGFFFAWFLDRPTDQCTSGRESVLVLVDLRSGDRWDALPDLCTVQASAWSSDGSMLAVGVEGRSNRAEPCGSALVSLDVASRTVTTLINGLCSSISDLAWSPDDTRLAYDRTLEPKPADSCALAVSQVETVVAAGGDPRAETAAMRADYRIAWHDDVTLILT